jgi:hypothetical protein
LTTGHARKQYLFLTVKLHAFITLWVSDVIKETDWFLRRLWLHGSGDMRYAKSTVADIKSEDKPD